MNGTSEKVFEGIDRAWDEEVAFLQSIVRQPSTLGNEAGVQRIMQGAFRRMELEVHEFEPDLGRIHKLKGFSPVEWDYKGRPNVVGVWRAKEQSGRSLVLNGHLDVVSPEPVHHWSYDPWGAEIVSDRMYGRGAMDMKSGVTAYTFAVRALQAAGVALKGDVILQAVIEEECSGNGTLACLDRGFTADGALVPEPQPNIMVAQVGVLWCRVTVKGSAGHVLSANTSANAIEKMYLLIEGMRGLEKKLNQAQNKSPAYKDHPWPINFNPGIIHGGDWASTVPAECVLQFRMGFYPEMSPEEAKEMVRTCIFETASKDPWMRDHLPEMTFVGFHAEGVQFDFNESPVAKLVQKTCREVTGVTLQPKANTCTTDARFFINNYGIPATCYGPKGANLHNKDEYVELSSVKDVTKVIAQFIMNWCGV